MCTHRVSMLTQEALNFDAHLPFLQEACGPDSFACFLQQASGFGGCMQTTVCHLIILHLVEVFPQLLLLPSDSCARIQMLM
jgi:hypothetical protein